MPLVDERDTDRKKISLIFSLGKIIQNGIVPININNNHVINIDSTQDFLSSSTILNSLFNIYIETKIKTDINNKSKNGMQLQSINSAQAIATNEEKLINICNISIKLYVC